MFESLIIIFILIFTASFTAFIQTLPGAFPHEELDKLLFSGNKSAERIHKVVTAFENKENGLLPVELFIYISTASFFSSYLILDFGSVLNYVIFILSYFVVIILFRTFFSYLAIRYDLKLALPFSRLIYFFWLIGKPFSSFFRKVNEFASTENEDLSRQELTALVETAHEEGAIDQEEYRILKNIMNFSEIIVSDVMTPRTVVFSLYSNLSIGEAVKVPELKMYSRIPLHDGKTLDDGVTGYVTTKDILYSALTSQGETELNNFAHEIHFIPEHAGLDVALEQFLKSRQHIFMVVDEYGGIDGLLTMEDVLETILGVEIVDEADRVVDLREFAKQARDKRISGMFST